MIVDELNDSWRKEKEKSAAHIGWEEYSKLAVVGETDLWPTVCAHVVKAVAAAPFHSTAKST